MSDKNICKKRAIKCLWKNFNLMAIAWGITFPFSPGVFILLAGSLVCPREEVRSQSSKRDLAHFNQSNSCVSVCILRKEATQCLHSALVGSTSVLDNSSLVPGMVSNCLCWFPTILSPLNIFWFKWVCSIMKMNFINSPIWVDSQFAPWSSIFPVQGKIHFFFSIFRQQGWRLEAMY